MLINSFFVAKMGGIVYFVFIYLFLLVYIQNGWSVTPFSKFMIGLLRKKEICNIPGSSLTK